MRYRVARFVLASALLAGSLPAKADTVYLKNGRRAEGRVVSETPEVVVNPYNSTIPEMTYEVERFSPDQVKKIVRTLPTPEHEFQKRFEAATTAKALLDLDGWCKAHHLKEERLYSLETALRLDPGFDAARKELGSPNAPKGDYPKELALAHRYLDAKDGAARAAVMKEIRADSNYPFDETYLERALRSRKAPHGYTEDVPVAMRTDKLEPNARYTILVPKGYDPLKPTPLLIGLHGGGAGGADGKLVVGSGPMAMPFYRSECERRGWICVCPTALTAGWGSKPNDALIDAVLDEVEALYNVDLNRVYLTGHSMGGGGAWDQGVRLASTWAAIAPTASFNPHGIDKLEKTKTGFYVYHSDDDPRCSVQPIRNAMKKCVGKSVDFVYTELHGKGHSLPQEIIADFFRYFDVRRRAVGRGRPRPAVRPESSFLRRVSRDEKRYLPPLGAAPESAQSLAALLHDLEEGGGLAEQAAPKLESSKDKKTSALVARILVSPRSASDVRRFAARILGARKAKDQIKPLCRSLFLETDSSALLAILDAIKETGDSGAARELIRFLKKRKEYFDKRFVGKKLIQQSDWQTILPTLGAACDDLGRLGEDKAAGAIADVCIDGILLSGVEVVFDRQNQRPAPYAEALARSACDALAKLADASAAAPALKRLLAAGHAKDGPKIRPYGGGAGVPAYVAVMGDWPADPAIHAAAERVLRTGSG